MDAITLLKTDNKHIEELFSRFEAAGDRAHVTKRDTVAEIVEQLSLTTAVTEQLFYPVTRQTVEGVEEAALESMERTRVNTWLLAELDGMDPTHEFFEAKVTVLADAVRRQRRFDEERYFPIVRDALGRKAMTELGDAMVQVKEVAPTHPHPRAPQSPTGNFVVGTAVGALDRMRDTARGIAQGGWNAAADLVARAQGRETAVRPSPTGSPTAQRVAERVRAAAAGSLDEAGETGEATTNAAIGGAKSTAKAARDGVAATAKSVKTGAKRTANTARASADKTKKAATATS